MKTTNTPAHRHVMILALGLIMTLLMLVWLFNGHLANAQSDDTRQPEIAEAQTGTGFTYQGQLNLSGTPANGNYTFQFLLYDAASSGTQVGTTQTKTIMVSEGLFTALLNEGSEFGATAFTGEARYLEIRVSDNGGSSYTTLTPRQSLTAIPYALSLRPGATISSTHPAASVLNLTNDGLDGSGLFINTAGTGMFVNSTAGDGLSVDATSIGVNVISATTGLRVGSAATGVHVAAAGVGVEVESAGTGLKVGTVTGNGVQVGSADVGLQVGSARLGINVDSAVNGIQMSPVTGTGLFVSSADYGVYVGGATSYAGYFTGKVNVTGNLSVQGTLSKSAGAFQIDHPLDPENQYLYHSFVESPDMKNIYDGLVVLDENGMASIQMADWFDALNQEFRYQLTPIGAAMPGLYIAQEMTANGFQIAGGEAGMKVSWQVTGIRHDPYAEANRIQVEVDKSAEERGTYLYPELYDQPTEMGLSYQKNLALDEQ